MLNNTHYRLLIRLASCQSRGKVFPSYKALGEDLEVGVKEVKKLLADLLEAGLVDGLIGRKPSSVTARGRQVAAEQASSEEFSGEFDLPTEETAAVLAIAPAPVAPRPNLTAMVASKFGIDPDRMFQLVARTMITTQNNRAPSKEEVAVVMHVMNKYDLDPLMKQLFAFEAGGKIHVMLGFDGWIREVRKAEAHGFMGIEIRCSEAEVTVPGTNRMVPEWMEGTGRWQPHSGKIDTTYRCFFDEWFVDIKNWKDHPYHRLHLKTYTQTARISLGIGLCDEVDRDQFEAMADVDGRVLAATDETRLNVRERLADISEKRVAAAVDEEPAGPPESDEDAGQPLIPGDLFEVGTGDPGPSDDVLDKQLYEEQVEKGGTRMNYAAITGHLGKDPELKHTAKDMAVSLCSVAVQGWSRARGKYVTWVLVKFLGKRAETVVKYLKKGDFVVVEGEICKDEWKDGETNKSMVYILSNSIEWKSKAREADNPEVPDSGSGY